MSDSPVAQASKSSGLSGRWTIAALVLAVLFVLMPFLFWQSTWFGRPLTDEKLAEYLADVQHPRKAQHALSQISDRIVRGDATVKRWYPHVVAAAQHAVPEIRITAAWAMGQDNGVPEFREALRALLADAHPMVRRNAALSLVRFGDASGRPELLAMLRPYAVVAPQAGTLLRRLKVDDAVNPGTLLCRIRQGEENHEVRSEVAGSVERWVADDNAPVSTGQEILFIAPSPEMVWEALRGLLLVGTAEDAPLVERYTRPVAGMPPAIQQQAANTLRAVRSRLW